MNIKQARYHINAVLATLVQPPYDPREKMLFDMANNLENEILAVDAIIDADSKKPSTIDELEADINRTLNSK